MGSERTVSNPWINSEASSGVENPDKPNINVRFIGVLNYNAVGARHSAILGVKVKHRPLTHRLTIKYGQRRHRSSGRDVYVVNPDTVRRDVDRV